MMNPRLDILLPGFPIGTDQGHPAFCGVFLIEGQDTEGATERILVDAAHVGRRPILNNALAERGLTPGDIDKVVLTHSHWDHVQNIDMFPDATVLIHRDERRYAHMPHANDWATPSWTGLVLEQLAIEEVADGYEIIPGVRVVDMCGHSIGSIGVLIETEHGRAAITGDALHFAYVAQTKRNPLVFWDEDKANQSIERILDLADVIYPGHDRPFRLTSANEIEYTREHRLTVTGMNPDMSSLAFDRDPEWPVWVMPGVDVQPERFQRAQDRIDQRIQNVPRVAGGVSAIELD
ncbi:MBL fold metallo-hydrolase [Nocardia amamiensis]|uniref:MBL fold metallo-hydrolase n=1 Tax=Nocardia amamiensis TaxID=404578 RepID=UPI00082A0E00|nr:MBL fold metallo-hydrolase [Nocardia amamiensis]